MKQYVKYNKETYQITEYAPKNKGSISNYNIEANNEMLVSDGYSYEDIDGEYIKGHTPRPDYTPEPTFAELQAVKLREINSIYTIQSGLVKIDTPEDEVLSWDIQRQQYQLWLIDSARPTPFVDALVTSRYNPTPEEFESKRALFMEKIGNKVAAYENYIGTLTGKRQKLEDLIKQATTKEELDAIAW